MKTSVGEEAQKEETKGAGGGGIQGRTKKNKKEQETTRERDEKRQTMYERRAKSRRGLGRRQDGQETREKGAPNNVSSF